MDNHENINILRSFEFKGSDGITYSIPFKGVFEGRVAYVLLAKDCFNKILLEGAFFQSYEIINELGQELLGKLQLNPEGNQDVIIRIKNRLIEVDQLQAIDQNELKELAIKNILEMEDPQEMQMAIRQYLFYGGHIWEIPKYLFENGPFETQELFYKQPTEFYILFERACQAISIGRKMMQEPEFQIIQATFLHFQPESSVEDETWIFHVLQRILIEKTNGNFPLEEPRSFDDSDLFQAACNLQLVSFARLLHECNCSNHLITPSVVFNFCYNLDYPPSEGAKKIWSFFEEIIDISQWSLADRRRFIEEILDLVPVLISVEQAEVFLIKLLKSLPEVDQKLIDKTIKMASLFDLSHLLDFLLFEGKYSDLFKTIKFTQGPISGNFPIIDYLILNNCPNSLAMICEKKSEAMDFKNYIASFALKSFIEAIDKEAKDRLLSVINQMNNYGVSESWNSFFKESSEVFLPLIQTTEKIANNELCKEKIFWILSCFTRAKTLGIPLSELQQNLKLFESLLNYRNPKERDIITNLLLSLYNKKETESLEKWKTIRASLLLTINTSKKKVWLIPALLFVPFLPNIDPIKDKAYLAYLAQIQDMFNGKRLQALSQLLIKMKENVSPKKANNWLLISLQSKESNERLRNWALLKTMCNLGLKTQLETLSSFNECLQVLEFSFIKTFNLHEIINFSEKYKRIESFRDPIALFTYQAAIYKGLHPDDYAVNEPILREFVKGILDGSYPDIRYLGLVEVTPEEYYYVENRHLKTIFNNRPQLETDWQKGDKKKAKDLFAIAGIDIHTKDPQVWLDPEWDVVDTDQDQDMLLMGEELQGSCQAFNYPAELTVCLLSYIMDGKIRMVAIKDSDGKIIGRCVLRIMWDPEAEKPVLFREKLYVNNQNKYVSALVKAECLLRAKTLGLTLLSIEKADLDHQEEMSIYPSIIQSLDGYNNEYVDAIEHTRLSTTYEIQEAKIIYTHPE